MQKEINKALQQLRVRARVCRQRYAQESQRFMVKYSIQESSPLGDVDAALATELNALFAAGVQRHKLDTRYYSGQHRLNLRDVDFREAAAAKAGVLTFDLYCRPSNLTAVCVHDVHMLKRKAPMITFFPANRDLM